MALVKGRKRMGRPPGSGKPLELVRRHRVVVTLNDGELEKLERFAESMDSPLGTAAYELVARGLKRVPAQRRKL